MDVYPAIDIRQGRVVRLFKGDFDKVTVYGDSPVETAVGFAKEGAKKMHVVDLDGALGGATVNGELIKRITAESGLFVQVGGGVRDAERIAYYLSAGVGRVVLGTAAAEDPSFLDAAAAEFGDRIAVGVDAADGRVATRGWKTVTDIDASEFCKGLRGRGVKTVVFTDISRDGTLAGANIEAYKSLIGAGCPDVIASGGVGSVEDIARLKAIGAAGVIVGRALYDGRLTLRSALKISEG